MNKTRFITESAVIAAMYAVLTILLMPISYGPLQVRVSEALTVLPFFTPAAIPGLFVGCIIANIVGGYGVIDIVFGSLATLGVAYVSYKIPKRFLVPIPPIVFNAVVVGFVLYFVTQAPLAATILWVGVGEAVACYAVGYPLMLGLDKIKNRVFKR